MSSASKINLRGQPLLLCLLSSTALSIFCLAARGIVFTNCIHEYSLSHVSNSQILVPLSWWRYMIDTFITSGIFCISLFISVICADLTIKHTVNLSAFFIFLINVFQRFASFFQKICSYMWTYPRWAGITRISFILPAKKCCSISPVFVLSHPL